jgi:hypothetical protein
MVLPLNGCCEELPIGLGAALAGKGTCASTLAIGGCCWNRHSVFSWLWRPLFVVLRTRPWRQGPAAGALRLGRIVVGTTAYRIHSCGAARGIVYAGRNGC